MGESIMTAGWRAMMVTDLECFTGLLEAVGDVRGRELMKTHNTLLRLQLTKHHGVEHAHTGDGMITSFSSTAHALHCAVGIQRSLRHLNRERSGPSLRVRIGVHAGRPLLDEGRLFGQCVNIAVRVCSVAAADQVLVSAGATTAFDRRPSPFELEELGPRALKGVSAPQILYRVRWNSVVPVEASVQDAA